MDPITLSVVATGLLSTIFEKALDKGIDAVLDEAGESTRSVYAWFRLRFGKRQELAALEEGADSPRRQKALADVVEAELVDDPATLSELERLMAAVQQDEPGVYQVAEGVGNVLVAGNNVTIHNYVNQTPPPPSGVRWRLQNDGGEKYILVNVGDATASAVTVDQGDFVHLVNGPRLTSGCGVDMEPDDAEVLYLVRSLQTANTHVEVLWQDEPSGPIRSKRLIVPRSGR